ncbi:hypothetical protein [uncultured Gimesia sp.]|uniref:hypothetical protein n=1 Tax=uncultured Gimesia sp. TaxID=1678688 RepID=UPI002634A8A6|nr:hypothetical protein [uncultured Gimesia sp.]
MNWDQIVQRHYPNAVTCTQVAEENLNYIEQELGGDRRTTLLASSRCADDLVATNQTLNQEFDGPFHLGGLAGFPFTGKTGMTAYANHIHEGGTAFILYGPHIGIAADGSIGNMLRPGQSRCTSTCGALVGAVTQIESGRAPASEYDDFQQPQIIKMLSPYQGRIFSASAPIQEATQICYELIHEQINQILDATINEFSCKRIVLVGGILINTDVGAEDYMTVENSEYIDL